MRTRAILCVLLSGCGFQLSLGADAPPENRDDADVVIDGDEIADAMLDDMPEMHDAAPIDAPALVCPAAYNITVLNSTSKYRFKKTGAHVGTSAADCANDGEGTHIVSLDSVQEIQLLHAAADAQTGWAIEQVQHPDDTLIWVGGVQRTNQNTPGANWITVSGLALPVAWADDEPNDLDMTLAEDGEEQFLVLWLEHAYLGDMIPDYDFGVICECDGLTPAAAFTTAFDAQD